MGRWGQIGSASPLGKSLESMRQVNTQDHVDIGRTYTRHIFSLDTLSIWSLVAVLRQETSKFLMRVDRVKAGL